MASLVREIDRELTFHTDIEEVVFYPWARELSDVKHQILGTRPGPVVSLSTSEYPPVS
jgi:hypothetical protein